ncbi:alkane 1-monooxygenase [Oceaniglobus ichthyenteri]|uniref:alkane 1-monooxygenase n=1 Tax=Oceaniglobus ichthyenteri TaxID=2136177 RepID=UPI000D3CBA27|nr:alkane 1-monooxygenase [Oceaniglobus ichthyenteri]
MKNMKPDSARLFAIATLLPVLPLLAGAFFGGSAVWLGLLLMTALVYGLDHLVKRVNHAAPPDATGEFPTGNPLSLGLAVAHFILLFAAVHALGRGTSLSALQHLGLFMGVGLWLGQVSNSNAHELIHRTDRRLFRVGKWLYISLLFGHHTSAHRKVHHRFVASRDDPNTAQLGESYYSFLARAWPDGFAAGWEMEKSVLTRSGQKFAMLRHPYIAYILGAVGFMGLAVVIGGFFGLIWYVALAGFAQAQLLLSDYVQHYGLERRAIDPTRLEPVGPHHSWNAPHWYSGAMMLNAPRHSDHHTNPAKPYPALDLGEDVPMLPRSLPVMGMIALWPPAWRRIMDKRAKAWRPKVRSAAA